MLAHKEKISCRQAILLLLMTTLSPAIRLFPQYTAEVAKQAGWLSPLISLIFILILILIMQTFYKKYKEESLSDIFNNILGNILGKALAIVYLLWILVLLALYLRYYAERIVSSILPNTPISFFTIIMLTLVLVVLRKGIVGLARINEIFLSMFILIFSALFLLGSYNIRFENLTPISYPDILPIIKGSYVITAIWGYFFFIFFFGDKINDKEHIKKFSLKFTLYLTVIAVALLIFTIGTTGFSVAERTEFPYFISIKQISVLGVLERFDSVVLSLWVIADFVIICVFTYIPISILKSVFNLSGTKSLISPVLTFAYIFSLYMTKNRFELSSFSSSMALHVNVVLEYVVPVLLLIVGKIRKKI